MRMPYKRRVKGLPDSFTYDIPPLVRDRIYYCYSDFCDRQMGDLQMLFKFLHERFLRQFGRVILGPPLNQYERGYVSHFENHWKRCDSDEFLTLLEWTFETRAFGGKQYTVDALNDIFRTEGIGYELSPYSEEITHETNKFGHLVTTTNVLSYPEITKKTNELVHSTVTMPTLLLLSGKLWSTANSEMLNAHRHLKDQNFPEAIFQAGCCLESVLKIICTKKQWTFVPDKDTLKRLLEAALKGKLFESPYVEIIQQSSGKIRNSWGGHGTAETTNGPATYEIAENMIQVTSSHILFLTRQAKIG